MFLPLSSSSDLFAQKPDNSLYQVTNKQLSLDQINSLILDDYTDHHHYQDVFINDFGDEADQHIKTVSYALVGSFPLLAIVFRHIHYPLAIFTISALLAGFYFYTYINIDSEKISPPTLNIGNINEHLPISKKLINFNQQQQQNNHYNSLNNRDQNPKILPFFIKDPIYSPENNHNSPFGREHNYDFTEILSSLNLQLHHAHQKILFYTLSDLSHHHNLIKGYQHISLLISEHIDLGTLTLPELIEFNNIITLMSKQLDNISHHSETFDFSTHELKPPTKKRILSSKDYNILSRPLDIIFLATYPEIDYQYHPDTQTEHPSHHLNEMVIHNNIENQLLIRLEKFKEVIDSIKSITASTSLDQDYIYAINYEKDCLLSTAYNIYYKFNQGMDLLHSTQLTTNSKDLELSLDYIIDITNTFKALSNQLILISS